MRAFDVYRYHQTLYLHFTTNDYDFFQYNAKSKNITESKFKKHPSKECYESLFRKYGSKKRIVNLFVSNMVSSGQPQYYPGHYLSNECHDFYLKWRGQMDRFSYVVEQETRRMVRYMDEGEVPYGKLIQPENGQHPLLLRYYYAGSISLETLIVYMINFKLAPYWNKKILDDLMWPTTLFWIRKYRPFMEFDKEKIRETLKNTLQQP